MRCIRSIHSVFWLAGCLYRKVWSSKTVIILIFAVIFTGETIFGKLLSLSEQTGCALNCLEPAVLLMSVSLYIMIIPLVFLVLLFDFPNNHTGGIFMMARIGRWRWTCGQILYAFYIGATWMGIVTAAGIVWVSRVGVFSNQWSPFMTELYVDFPEVYALNQSYFLGASTVAQGKPLGVLLTGTALMLLYLVVIAQILCLFRFAGVKRLGMVFCMAVTVFGAVSGAFLDKVKWIFPLAHSIYSQHFREIFVEPECRIVYSFLYFAGLILLLGAVSRRMAKNFQIGDECE